MLFLPFTVNRGVFPTFHATWQIPSNVSSMINREYFTDRTQYQTMIVAHCEETRRQAKRLQPPEERPELAKLANVHLNPAGARYFC